MNRSMIIKMVAMTAAMSSIFACKKQVEEKPRYSTSFEITVPVDRGHVQPEAFCPVALQIGADRGVMQRLQQELSGEDGMSGSKYTHCTSCSIGVYRIAADAAEATCSYCGEKQHKGE